MGLREREMSGKINTLSLKETHLQANFAVLARKRHKSRDTMGKKRESRPANRFPENRHTLSPQLKRSNGQISRDVVILRDPTGKTV